MGKYFTPQLLIFYGGEVLDYCQKPNLTKTSIQQSLSLDYIFTVISTHPTHPTHHQELTVLLLLLTALPAAYVRLAPG